MRRTGTFLIILLVFSSLQANNPRKKGKKFNPKQLDEVVITPKNPFTSYRATYPAYFDLVHTSLKVKPVFSEKKLYGTAELTLTPHFYEQNQLILDAKWMRIRSVELLQPGETRTLSYSYDTLQLKIDLGKYFRQYDTLKVRIQYVAEPYTQDSNQVADGRGMYFIDVEDKNPYKPMHLWTQGEEESSSCWFPTIEATYQKTSQELWVTLDTAFISLSNGLLVSTVNNGDGTKTDYWKQDLPHSPYLFFLGIGDYFKHSDSWRGKEVSAYTFPKYKDVLPEIFKNLPEMMEFFSKQLGVDYPWDKLSNIIAFDYTAGAMENTSAIIYYDRMLCDHRHLLDGSFDWIIAHELYHHWFGDLTTAESWANLTLNESFADYSEYLWAEYKYGKEEADAYAQSSLKKYLHASAYKKEPIVNYYYEDSRENFDELRYEKGGRVLHLLRNYIGDAAFFEATKRYLQKHAFKSAELADWRMAVEEVTGQDMNWFFNQWWLDKGHPILDVAHLYDEKNKTIQLTVKQIQTSAEAPVFRIPTKVDVYFPGGKKETHSIDIIDRNMTFYLPAGQAPLLVNFDADKVLLCEKKEALSEEQLIYKLQNAPLFLDKLEAIKALSPKQKGNQEVQSQFIKMLQHSNYYLRSAVADEMDVLHYNDKTQLSIALQQVVNTDNSSQVREKALNKLVKLEKGKSVAVLENVLTKDSSYLVLAAALTHLQTYQKQKAYAYALQFSSTENATLMPAVAKVLKDSSDAELLPFFQKIIWLNTPRNTYSAYRSFNEYLEKVDAVTLEKAMKFLVDIVTYEESDYNAKSAKQLARSLQYYFQQRAKKDSGAAIKQQIVQKVGAKLLH